MIPLEVAFGGAEQKLEQEIKNRNLRIQFLLFIETGLHDPDITRHAYELKLKKISLSGREGDA